MDKHIVTATCKARKVDAGGVRYEMGTVAAGTPFESDGVQKFGYILFDPTRNWWVPVTCVKRVTDETDPPPVDTSETMMRMRHSPDGGVTWTDDERIWKLKK